MDAPNREELSPVKRALLELRDLRLRLDQAQRARTEPIAIVGLSCRFPGAANPEAFWELLRDGRDAVTEVPAERWRLAQWFDADPDAPGKMATRHGGFLTAVDRFDAPFFGITPREAERLDPQQRLLLEVAWEALERAAISPDRLSGDQVGVFVGLSNSDYFQLQLQHGATTDIDAYMASGSSPAVAAGRIAYTLGLQGPAITIDTACSSSLSAVHLACQSLRDGECSAALAGGVSLILVPELTVNFSKARMMAPDGRCKTFDARADGYVRSEGCGIVVLKRLSDAQAAGDRILAVVSGSAVNQDGRSSGLTVPNGPAQESVVREALRRSSLQPVDVDYVEAHGTGTALGDPIELRALGAVFADRPADRPLAVGSVKTNVGHLEAAAGIAGLIKVVLAMEHAEIPRHLHFESPTPHVDWQALPLAVPAQAQPWPLRNGRRVGGVSSFGFSGTNAHVVVMSAPAAAPGDQPKAADTMLSVLPLSAKTPAALRAAASQLAGWLDESPDVSLTAVCDTAGRGRAHFPHRLAVVAGTASELRDALRAYGEGRPSGALTTGSGTGIAPDVAFLFTGQGSQYAGMGRALYERSPVYRAALDRCDEVLRPLLAHPLLDVMFDRHGRGVLLDETAFTQPALFALEYALSELWRAWGVRPAIVLGHSLGEDVAACAAGMIGLEDGLRLVAERGRLMQSLPKSGEMRAVFAGAERLSPIVERLGDDLSIAAINGPEHTTVSGTKEAIAALSEILEREGIRTKAIAASHAFHSRLMDPALDAYEAAASRAGFRRPEVTLISNVTGDVGTDDMLTPRYWRRHVREAVRFSDSIATAWRLGARLFVEIGPGASLVGLGERCLTGDATWIPSLRRDRDEWREMLTSLSILYSRGVAVDWSAVPASPRRQVVAIPTYPFQRERHWTSLPGLTRPHTDPAPDVDRRWSQVADATARQSGLVPIDLALSTYQVKWQRLDELALEFIAAAFASMGVFRAAGERLEAAQLGERTGTQPSYLGLVSRWLDVLGRHGRLVREGESFVAPGSFADASQVASRIADESREQFADFPALLDYVTRCGTRLAGVVTGRDSALETLFPGGSAVLADQLYGLSAMARYFNGMVRGAVEAAAATSTPSRPLRVLEIGGGTGGTTRGLLAALQADRAEYWFTDVGPLFLSRAREAFSAYSFVRYQLLDIERPPVEQSFSRHSFDVVVASNVLHATRDLRETLANVASLLSPSGALVMYEATAHPLWFDVTTGLINGWQRFDDDIRTDVPLIAPERWAAALAGAGFVDTRAYPEAGSPAAVMGQHVIVSRGPLAVAGNVNDRRLEETALDPGDERSQGPGRHVAAEDPAFLLAELMALPVLNRRERLVGLVRDQVVAVLRLDPSQPPDRQQRLMDLGVDSLMAVELRNRLTTSLALERTLPATLIFDYPTIEAIAELLATSIGGGADRPSEEVPASADAAAETAVAATAALVEDLDDEAVEALLNARLDNLQDRHGRR